MVKSDSIAGLVALHSKAQAKIDKMIENNEALPEVIFNQFRHYHVASSDGKKFYSVQLGAYRNSEGNAVFWVACCCYGALHKETCYHSLLALQEHLKEVERCEQAKQTERKGGIHDADNAPYLKQGSDKKPKRLGSIGGI